MERLHNLHKICEDSKFEVTRVKNLFSKVNNKCKLQMSHRI